MREETPYAVNTYRYDVFNQCIYESRAAGATPNDPERTYNYVNERGHRVWEREESSAGFQGRYRLFAPGVDQLVAVDWSSYWTIQTPKVVLTSPRPSARTRDALGNRK